jgi:hypothetical protein
VADEDMDDGEMWRAIREQSQQKRASNREQSAQLLAAAGLGFVSRNGGAHLIVEGERGEIFDFWPGTGLWMSRADKVKRRGVQRLIKRAKAQRGV